LTAYNYIFILNFLPMHVPREYMARVWLNVSEFTWLYGWIVLGVYLPAWAYYWRKKYGYSLETEVRVGIGFVVILLIGGSCAAHISTDGMDLGGRPSSQVGFSHRTRNRCGLGSCSAGVGFYLLQLRVTGPTPRSRKRTCSFGCCCSLYHSGIKFVNGGTLRRSRRLDNSLSSSSQRF
jgi:hypothetical protein